MSNAHNDEIDLVYVIKKLKQLIKKWIVLLFKAIDFCLKYWYVIAALLIIGIGLGWYQVSNRAKKKNAHTVVKVNYKLQSYVYKAIENYNAKAKEYDSVYLSKLGFYSYNPQIKEIELEPIIDFKDILEEYKFNDRGLDILLKNVDFDDDEENPLKELFAKKYNYFELKFKLSSTASPKDIETFIAFINQEPKLQAYKKQAKETLGLVVEENEKSIALINDVLKSYISSEASLSQNTQVDKGFDLNTLLEAKQDIQLANEKRRNELVIANDIIVPLQEIVIKTSEGRLLDKKHIVYPILFVFGFLFIAYVVYIFKYLRNIAVENE